MQTLPTYEIRIKGHLDERWMRYFEGLTTLLHPNGETMIAGPMDQAMLHGILNRIRDLGLELIAVNQSIGNDQNEEGKNQ
jgi:hypothetical protein